MKGTKISQMIGSNMIQTVGSTELAIKTGRMKCERAISLADCSCLATAKEMNAYPVFATREIQLGREMKRKPFEVDPIFLQDIQQTLQKNI
jgi:hypothetical protein